MTSGTHIVNGGNKQQRHTDDVEDDDAGQNHQHVHRAVKAKGQLGSPERDEEPEGGREKSTPVNDKTKLKSTTFNRISENLGQLFLFSCLEDQRLCTAESKWNRRVKTH